MHDQFASPYRSTIMSIVKRRRPPRPLGRIRTGLVLVVGVLFAGACQGQEAGEVVAAVGGGMTLYSIDTRFDDGTVLRGSVGYSLLPYLMVEGGGRWHRCFDCDRFLVAEAGVQLRHPGPRWSPFVAVGGGRSSDPGFMGPEWGLYAAVGSWLWSSGGWGLQLEARGRQVGQDDYMGEFSVGAARRFLGIGR